MRRSAYLLFFPEIHTEKQFAHLQAVEFRIRKLEELSQQTLAHLGVIHRFMATYMPNEGLSGLETLESIRQRRVSERSEAFSEADSHTQLPLTTARRKRLLRSLTDATFLNAGHPIEDDVLKMSETMTSRENLSRHDSSVSVDAHVVHDDVKTTTSLETEGSKDVLEGETKKEVLSEKEMSRDTSKEVSREVSMEVTSKEASMEQSREVSRDASKEASSENPPSDIRQDSTERTFRQDSTDRSTFRQNSRTRSESDDFMLLPPPGIQRAVTWAEPRVAVIPSSVTSAGSAQRSILLTMRAEYTSITDELESYCGLWSPPRTPPLSPPPSRTRNISEISNPEIAWQIENEHLRDAEECDYQQMEDLIQRRYCGDDDNNDDGVGDGSGGGGDGGGGSGGNGNDGLLSKVHADESDGAACFFSVSNEHRQLRRVSAIDEDSRRPPPTISVTREIEQTLARPPIRDCETTDLSDKNLSTVPAPASETMC